MKIVVDQVEREDERDRWRIEQTITADDGTTSRLLYVLPLDTMEWRAAEYGIDPTDTATLLDIVIAEPHLTPEDWAAGSQLHDAPDIKTARRDHLARCVAVKLRYRISTRTKGSPLDRVRTESHMDPEAIAVKAQHVGRIREQLLANTERLRARPPSRVEELRRRLLPPESPRTQPHPDFVEES